MNITLVRAALLAVVVSVLVMSGSSTSKVTAKPFCCTVATPSDVIVERINSTKLQVSFFDNTEDSCWPLGVGFEIDRSVDDGDFELFRKARRPAFEWENPVVIFDYTAPTGHTYCYRVRAVGDCLNFSGYSDPGCE